MEVTKPDLPAVKRLLDTFVGRKVWGVKLSIAWLSIELGDPWHDSKGVERGTATLFMSCSWTLREPRKRVVTSEMERTQKWCQMTAARLEGRTLVRYTFSDNSHALVLEFRDGIELNITPHGGKNSLDEWTFFFRVLENQTASVTFNGSTISYED